MATTSIEDAAAQQAPAPASGSSCMSGRTAAWGKNWSAAPADNGYEALIVTVNVPVAGARLRDVRNGLTIPPSLTLRTLTDGVLHPAWWLQLPVHRAPAVCVADRVAGDAPRHDQPHVRPRAVTIADLDWLRRLWHGPLIIKGIQTPADARLVVNHGADAVVVSNHGGRQLDRAPAPLELLPAILDATGGDAEVYLDTGILTGGDIVAALALGARGCLVGRAFLYGLMAGGERGVQRATQILTTEITRTLQLLGVPAADKLTADHASLPAR